MKTNPTIRKRVLLVDDEEPLLRGVKKALEDTEILVDTADTVEDSLTLLASMDYDVVISDIRLTGVMHEEGFEILKYVKEQRPATKVFIMSGYGNPELKTRAFSLGADRYFEKPVPARVLKKAMINCCG
jgi:DNA-binding NtrC family response regulator